MICNNSSAAAGGGIKKLTFNPADISISYVGWDTGRMYFSIAFSGLTKDKLGKGCIVGVFTYNRDASVLLYISPDGSAEVVTRGSDVKVTSAYNPSAGTVSFSVYMGNGSGFVFRQD